MTASLRRYIRSFSDEPDLQLIALVQVAYRIARGFVTVFLPVFFYQQGLSIGGILLFYWLNCLFVTLAGPLGAVVIDRLGPDRAILFSLPFMVTAYGAISYVSQIGFLFVMVALLFGLHNVLYHSSVHYTIIPALDIDNSGKQLATLSLLSELGRYLAPVVAGSITILFGFGTLFALAAVIVALSALPLLFVELEAKKRSFGTLGELMTEMNTTWTAPARIGSFAGYALSATINRVVWPVFVTVFVGGLLDLGLITTISALIGMALVYGLGLGSDRGIETNSLWGLSAIYSCVFALRAVASTPFVATVIESARRPLYKGLLIPWKKQTSTLAKNEHTLSFIIAREMTYKGVRVVVLPFLIAGFAAGLSLGTGLIIGGVLALFIPVIGFEYTPLRQKQ